MNDPNSLDDAVRLIRQLRQELALRPSAAVFSAESTGPHGFNDLARVQCGTTYARLTLTTPDGTYDFLSPTCIATPTEAAKYRVDSAPGGSAFVTLLETYLRTKP